MEFQKAFTTLQTRHLKERQALSDFVKAARYAIGCIVTGGTASGKTAEELRRSIAQYEMSTSGVLLQMKDLLTEVERSKDESAD